MHVRCDVDENLNGVCGNDRDGWSTNV